MEKQKLVTITGLSTNNRIGGLEATQLTFDSNNKLVVVKGASGHGKSTFLNILSTTVRGTQSLVDKNLYGTNFDATGMLKDGDYDVYIHTRHDKNGKLVTTTYAQDKDGNKLKDVVLDGKKLTPANYLKALQTPLSWRLPELTSENPTTQRNILLELYAPELEKRGLIFDKKHPKYVGGIIDKIEKAKNDRNFADMKRKEVGGITSDLNEKGIPHEERRVEKPVISIKTSIAKLEAEKQVALTNPTKEKESKLKDITIEVGKIKEAIRLENERIQKINTWIDGRFKSYNDLLKTQKTNLESIKDTLKELGVNDVHNNEIFNLISSKLPKLSKPKLIKLGEIQYNTDNQIISKPGDFTDKLNNLLTQYRNKGLEYHKIKKSEEKEVDVSDYDTKIESLKKSLQSIETWNQEAKAINALHNWKDADKVVKDLQQDYYMKLTEINTGVEGLHIAPESPDSKDIFLMYDGSYDPEYFRNPKKELRKLSSYSSTQRPLICLLIQKYLLSKKAKCMPYLWIDDVPIDNTVRALLERMVNEMGIRLFVSWTGDFEKANLKDGELLIHNGEIITNQS